MLDTKEKMLRAAESLFSQHGFSATSVRMIAAEADVNLAAMHYHFGSKEKLMAELFAWRLDPLNQERLQLLDQCEAEAGEEPPILEKILEAFIGPPIRLSRDPERGGVLFMRLLGRAFTEPSDRTRQIVYNQFGQVIRRFSAALSAALPQLSPEELFWRFHFMVGAMAHTIHTMADEHQLHELSGGACHQADVDATVNRLVPFLAAALRSPSSAEESKQS
jgi:AcrR family transcriptional regulator